MRRSRCRHHDADGAHQTFHTWTTYLRAWLDRRVPDMLAAQSSLSELKIMNDPEALFQIGILFCDVGEFDPG